MVTIYIPKLILDRLQQAWSGDLVAFLSLLAPIKLFLIYGKELLDQKMNHEGTAFNWAVSAAFSDKIMKVKYELLEDPEALDQKERAWAPNRFGYIPMILEQGQAAISSLVTILSIVFILIQFSLLLFLSVTLFAVAGYLIEEKISLAMRDFQKNLIPINRRYNYYFSRLLDDSAQKDLRLYRTDDLLLKKVNAYNDELYRMIREVRIKTAYAKSLSALFIGLSRFILYGYAGLRTLGIWGAKISLGSFSVLIGANESYANALRSFGLNLAQIFIFAPMMQPLLDYFDLEEMEKGGDSRDEAGEKSSKQAKAVKKPGRLQSLTFEGVSFTYPKTDRQVLDRVSFQLSRGESLAIVGRNNAGKSTIVKLICRLFEPDEGKILWNGTDIRDFAYSDYLEELACVFQDFKLFPLRIWENLTGYRKGFGPPEGDAPFCSEGRSLSGDQEEELYALLDRVEMKETVRALPQGLNSWLDKTVNEDAAAFSGGQLQKLAIARAIYSDSSVAILDEPTAALDPLAESEVYGHFADLVRGKTAIFISHRMSASRFCDRIIVLDGGHITGNGNHDQLIRENDLYRSLYEAQAGYYR